MMKMLRALAALVLIGSAAAAQPVGQIPAGTVWGNSTGARAVAKAEQMTAMLDRAFCSTTNAGLFRNASAWVCMTSLPAAMQLNITQLGTITAGTWQGTPISLGFIAQIAHQRMLANISGGAAAPAETTWTAWMDSVCGSTRGMLAWRSVSGWACLPIGGSGTSLSSNGTDISWSAAGSGTVTSVTFDQGLTASANPITTSGTARLFIAPNAQTGTTYTFLNSDCGKLVTFSNASSIAGTLPQAGASSQFVNGCSIAVQNRGAGTLTITPTTSTIDGAASLTLPTNYGVIIYSDGTNYFTMRGRPQVATNSEIWTGAANKTLDAGNVFNSAGQLVSLTDAVTISVDFNAGFNFTVTLAGNRTLDAPSNAKVGQTGCIFIVQDGTGSRTLAYHANWKFGGGTDPVLTTTAGAVDVLCYVVRTSTFIFASMIKDVK